jgi:hypothetical protein
MSRFPTLTQLGSILLFSLIEIACGGNEPPPAAPAPAPAAPAAPAPAPVAAKAAPAADEAWEGEAEAKGEAPAGGAETRTTEVVARVIKDNRKPFRECYERGTKDLPDVQGSMTIHFVLSPDGKVKSAELNQERSTIKAPPVVDCAISVLKGLKFPPSSRGMESVINYPFDFRR